MTLLAELIELHRLCCDDFKTARMMGCTASDEAEFEHRLNRLEEKIESLKEEGEYVCR